MSSHLYNTSRAQADTVPSPSFFPMNLKKALLSLLVVPALTACGGGGGGTTSEMPDGESNPPPESPPPESPSPKNVIGELAREYGDWNILQPGGSMYDFIDREPVAAKDLRNFKDSPSEGTSLLERYRFKGIAEVRRGDKIWPNQRADLIASFEGAIFNEPHISGEIIPQVRDGNTVNLIGMTLGQERFGQAGISGYGGPGSSDSPEKGEWTYDFFARELVAGYAKSNEDSTFAAVFTATKVEP